jgi:hypothetical protein
MQRGLGVSVVCMAARCTCDVHRNVHANVHGERNQGSRAKLAGGGMNVAPRPRYKKRGLPLESSFCLPTWSFFGAEDGVRTRDPHLANPTSGR